MISRIRSALTAALYRHTTALRACDVSDSAAITLMGTDVERIVDALTQFHELWASVLQVGIATWLLARQMSFAALVPMVVCVGVFPG
jgi:ATP-binding cassette subfamily C (CFTR/MRP) protein 1